MSAGNETKQQQTKDFAHVFNVVLVQLRLNFWTDASCALLNQENCWIWISTWSTSPDQKYFASDWQDIWGCINQMFHTQGGYPSNWIWMTSQSTWKATTHSSYLCVWLTVECELCTDIFGFKTAIETSRGLQNVHKSAWRRWAVTAIMKWRTAGSGCSLALYHFADWLGNTEGAQFSSPFDAYVSLNLIWCQVQKSMLTLSCDWFFTY